jgi:hypothetical protein
MFQASGEKVLLRIRQGTASEVDWLQFYAVQFVAWSSLAIISLGLFVVVSIIAKVISSGSNWWEYVALAFGSIPPGVLAFLLVIQAHGVCIDRVVSSNRITARIVRYFRYPRAINLLIVPAAWLAAFIILGILLGLI